jgi:ParB-like chromosome segregation protein Spo0J
MSTGNVCFEMERVTIPLAKLLPLKQVTDADTKVVRYRTILSSLREVGLVEALMVFPKKGKDDLFLILDGNLRHHALQSLGMLTADCLIATDEECFTYNARVSRLSPVQEHKMITRAVNNGVAVGRIAAALNMDVRDIKNRLLLVRGIHEDAVEMLKDKQISEIVFRILKRVTSDRQIEIAELMVSANNFSKGYAEGLFMVTAKDKLVDPAKPKSKMLAPEDVARMEEEMAILERDFSAIEDRYAENMLNLTVIRGYVKKLLENNKVARFLTAKHQDLLTEFERIAVIESM